MLGSREGVQGRPAVSRGPGGRGVSASLQHRPAGTKERSHLCRANQRGGCRDLH